MKAPQKGNTSIFARPLEPPTSTGPSLLDRAFEIRPASGFAIAGLVVMASAVLLLQPRSDGAQNLSRANKKAAAKPAPRVRIAMAERGNTVEKTTETTRPPLDFYTKGVRGSMFSAPVPPKPKEPAAPKPVKLPTIKVAPVNPFLDWNYAGSVTAGDKKLALLENRLTKEGQYVREGQTFMGAQVKSVTDQIVTLNSAGKPYPIAKSDEINTTPLSNSAAYLTAQNQPQQQAQTQVTAQMMGAWMRPQDTSGAGIMLPNGRTLTADQTQRYMNRMNSRFNGNGGRGGGQNGFGGGGGNRGGRGGGGGGGFGGGRGGRGGGGGTTIMVAPGG